MRGLSFACWAVLAIASARHYAKDRAVRLEAETFARRYGFETRRPQTLAEIEVAPAGDLSIQHAASGAVDDLLTPVPFATLSFAERQRWLAAVSRYGAELKDAEAMMLKAVPERPGWAYHRLLLGQVVYAAERRKPVERRRRPELWDVPLSLAAALAPGDAVVSAFRAGAWLETWESLPAPFKAGAAPLFRQAFRDDGFVLRSFEAAIAALGPDTAMSLLPERAGSLRKARDEMAKAGRVSAAAELQDRWGKAERAERDEAMRQLARRAAQGDLTRLRAGCELFMARHSPLELDDAAERSRYARLLELWPGGVSGPWREDPRGELVRFFLDGRLQAAKPSALASAVASLTNVPEVTAARIELLSGDRGSRERMVGASASTTVGFGWTPFLVELTWAELDEGRPERAAAALSLVARPALGECEVLLARRAVARSRRDAAEEGRVSAALEAARPTLFRTADWSEHGTLSLCVDPERDRDRVLEVDVAPADALISWGWDGAASGWRRFRGPGRLAVPLAGVAGRRSFSLRSLAGDAPSVTEARIVSAGRGARASASAPEGVAFTAAAPEGVAFTGAAPDSR